MIFTRSEGTNNGYGSVCGEAFLWIKSTQFKLCKNFYKVWKPKNIPSINGSNVFPYELKPIDLPKKLDELTGQLI